MDVQYPYADGIARLRLLYRLPLPPGPLKVLQVGGDAGSPCVDTDGPGGAQVLPLADLVPLAATHPGRFDAVALPGTWDAAGADTPAAVLASAWDLLVPGGFVVGHCAHLAALRHLGSVKGLWRAARSRVATAGACQAALRAAGFQAVQCFYVQPQLADPMGLIPTDKAASRAHFLRAVRAEQGHFGRVAYAARIALSQCGLGGLQQAQLFYWACKPC
jgi:hypothetical protein